MKNKNKLKFTYPISFYMYKYDGKNDVSEFDIHIDFDNIIDSPVYAKLYVGQSPVILLTSNQLKVLSNELSLIDTESNNIDIEIIDETQPLRLRIYASADDINLYIGDSSFKLLIEDVQTLAEASLVIANSIDLTK